MGELVKILFLLLNLSLLNAQPMTSSCPPLSHEQLGISYSVDPDVDGNYPEFTTATYDLCSRENSERTIGGITRVCDLGEWSGTQPTCEVIVCEVLSIDNGQITYTPSIVTGDSGYRVGTTAVYSCDSGFGFSGRTDSVCTGNVVADRLISVDWVPPVPVCEPQCPDLLSNLGRLRRRGIDRVVYSDASRLNCTIATYVCSTEFNPTNGLTRKCIPVNGTADWSDPEPACERPCPVIQLGKGIASITYSPSDRGIGSIATHVCLRGYVPDEGSDLRRTCMKDNGNRGFWDSPEETCSPIVCPVLPSLGNGTITYSNDNLTLGTFADHECNEGYALQGSTRRECVAGNPGSQIGMWAPTPGPVCEPQCPSLPDLENGRIEYNLDSTPDYDVGTVASHFCNNGYILIGFMNRVCQDSRQWSREAPVCEPQCPVLDDLANGRIEYSPDTEPGFDVGTNATHICNDGFVLNGNEVRECLETGEWSEEPPTCEPQCPPLSELANGAITYTSEPSPGYEVGTVANHNCSLGYRLVGSMSRVCLSTRAWSGQAPICEPQCPPLDPLGNGSIVYSPDDVPDYDVGTNASHTCITGFALIGERVRVCLASREWSNEPPMCEPIQCPVLPPLGNGTITYDMEMNPEFGLMTMATHRCNTGFELDGSMVRTCMIRSSNDPEGVWDLSAPRCRLILCPQLPSILNGNITYSDIVPPQYDIDSTATYQCNPGYCLSERVERVCQVDRTWSGSAPQCELITCPLLNVTENGQVIYTDNTRRVGTIATYTCTPPYQIIGTMQRTCLSPNTIMCEDGIWSGSEPLCRITNTVNDTVTGDPLMTVPLYIADKSALNVTDDDIVNLCFELHGTHDAFFNLVSDGCVSVNAHYNRVLPNDPREDINIIDGIYVRASDNAGVCRNIEVSLDRTTSGCAAFVDDVSISSMYQSQGISVRVYSNRVRVMVPNCDDLDLVMWIFCRLNIFRSTHLTVPNTDIEAAFTAPMLRFVIARGFNLQETSHGILGQFWNVPIQVQPFNGTTRPSVTSTSSIYEITVRHPDSEVRRFTGWFWPLTWEFRSEYCLYAGNQQAGPVYEVLTPNEAVIEGAYKDYLMDDSYDFEFMFSRFENSSCSDSTL